MSFEHLFSPLRVGSMTLRNRIVMAPHGVTFSSGFGSMAERVIDYHIERAKGGAALIVMSNFVMPPSWRALATWGGRLELSALGGLDVVSDRQLMPAYARLIQGVHQHGARFVSQLNAGGRQHYGPGMVAQGIPLVAPSPVPCPRTRHIPREMEIGEIEEYVDTYVQSAVNLQEAGADGVEVFAAQGYLLHEFLSPASNWRTDRYGGSLENRMRFLLDILRGIRRAAGPGFVIGVRLNGDDFAPAGIDATMAQDIARALTAQALVDYLNVSGMTYLQYPAWIADMTAPEATFSDLAEGIRDVSGGTPVCVVTRIGSPEAAEKILAEGKADMVGMVRALIADPELPNKAQAGDLEDIRLCTFSNQSCSMGLQMGRGVSCLHNVAVGKEAQLGIGTMRPAAKRKRVVVVGGGPAGMAAARIAAERQHSVIVLEKAWRLGGQNLMTASIATRRQFGEVTRWQEHRLKRFGVEIILNMEATRETILSLDPDAVIVATGSLPRKTGYSGLRPDVREIPGAGGPNVLSVWDVFDPNVRLARQVLVVDDDPHFCGAYVAEHLADHGHAVHLATSQLHPLPDLPANFVPALYRRLGLKGIHISTNAILSGIGPDHVFLTDRFSSEVRRIDNLPNVVLSMGNEANNGLHHALRDKVGELYAIGDCVTPRRIDDAILDGERAGWML